MSNKLETLIRKLISKPSRTQIWEEDHNDSTDWYSHGLLNVDSSLNFYSSIKTWTFDRTNFKRDKHYKDNFLTLFINIYYFNNKEDFKLQDASFTELRLKKVGKNLQDFSPEINKIEKFIRINRCFGIIKDKCIIP